MSSPIHTYGETVEELTGQLSCNKAPGKDSIPNKVFIKLSMRHRK